MKHALTLIALLFALPVASGQGELKLLASDGRAEDRFGNSVAISGTTAIVGAPSDNDNGYQSGSAYLFDATTGTQITKLLASDGGPYNHFGNSVAISGTTAIVGAYYDDDNGQYSGSAYIFNTTTGNEIAKLLASDGESRDYFGNSVAISGTTAIVGAHGDIGANPSGSAYLFDTMTGTEIAKLLPSDGANSDEFGYSVAISGTTAIVGANWDDDNGSKSGSAYLFDTTTGNEIAKLLPSDGAANDFFGRSVAISGTTAIVGAYGNDDNGPSSGSAYLFDITTGTEIAKLLPSDGAADDRFGDVVAISGTTAIIGAYYDDDNGSDSGSVYLFDATTGTEITKLLASDGATNDWFGESVAISGATTIVGAPSDDDNGSRSGSAYLQLFDCNENGVDDSTDISNGTSQDCNSNGGPDECDIGNGTSGDCNTNSIPDECDIASGYSTDCDGDATPDACQIADNPNLDLNLNGVLDSCECIVESYCVTSPNSAGTGTVMGVTGSAFVSINDLVLVALSCPANQFGIFYYGAGQAQASFGNGYRCVSPGGVGLYRFPIVNTGSLGLAAYPVDYTNPPQTSGQITAGSTWNFQFWYRDPAAGGAYFNLSDGLEITFCP